MRVGFMGGSSMFDLGDVDSMMRFSDVIVRLSDDYPDARFLHDRLFRTYVRLEDVGGILFLMRHAKGRLVEGVEANDLETVDITVDKVGEINRYFDAFEYCVENSVYFYHRWKILKPVRVVRVDTLGYLQDSGRSLESIGQLEDSAVPFWQREPKPTSGA